MIYHGHKLLFLIRLKIGKIAAAALAVLCADALIAELSKEVKA